MFMERLGRNSWLVKAILYLAISNNMLILLLLLSTSMPNFIQSRNARISKVEALISLLSVILDQHPFPR